MTQEQNESAQVEALSIPSLTALPKTEVAFGIFAWNEENAVRPMVSSLFAQSIFAELDRRQWRSEILCVLNGCTDRTPAVAREIFERQSREHPNREAFSTRVAELPERGKINAWNQFVHALSAKSARFLFMMDADILIHRPETMWNMLEALERDPQASVSVDRPCKDLSFSSRKSFRNNLSLAASQMTRSAAGQLCGQLYCIRAEVARKIYLPKDLAACEDGFIKALVCTDFLTRPVAPERIRLAEGAEHTFEAYTRPTAILRNQKRQLIGQTIVHILVDEYLPGLPVAERRELGRTLREKDDRDPLWLKRVIETHLQRRHFFWRLYPGLLSQSFRRWAGVPGLKRLTCFPAAAAGFFAALLASWTAFRALKRGRTNYWPRAQRGGIATRREEIGGKRTTSPLPSPPEEEKEMPRRLEDAAAGLQFRASLAFESGSPESVRGAQLYTLRAARAGRRSGARSAADGGDEMSPPLTTTGTAQPNP
ncbi:Glycosyl transferase family 2 (modular protein) [Verrucomicrobia bacterium]|nr:Glycosyl transferase family 2 (modular protein) [Verrucomicrobiota bacterium]